MGKSIGFCICKIWRIHRDFLNGTHPRHCLFFMHRPYPWFSVGRYFIEYRRGNSAHCRDEWFWVGTCLAFWLVCTLSKPLTITAQIRWLDEHPQSHSRVYRIGIGHQIPIQRRPRGALGYHQT